MYIHKVLSIVSVTWKENTQMTDLRDTSRFIFIEMRRKYLTSCMGGDPSTL